jgi:uncharacterized protein YndB with AHSA1/START domain
MSENPAPHEPSGPEGTAPPSIAPDSPDRSHGEPGSSPERVLRIERNFSARRERVYAAWTEGALLRAWSCPEGLTVGEAWNDLRVGGRFLLEMLEPDSDTRHVATGRYLEIDPPRRIVMTHGWLHEGETPEAVDERATHVTVTFFEEGPHTRMVFVQRGFPSDDSRDGHDEGWKSSFRQLDTLLASMGGDP